MAFPQILTVPTPLRDKPQLTKKLRNTTKQIRRIGLSRIKMAKRYASQVAKRHYFLTAAYRDLRRAASQNEDVVLSAVALSFMLVYACSAVATGFVLDLSRTLYALSEASSYDMGLLLVAATPMILVFCVLIAAALLNFMSLAIMDGANRKVYRTIRSTAVRSLSAASRIACSWLLLGIVHFARLLAVLIPISLYIKFFSDIAVLPVPVLIAIGTLGAIWLFAGVLQYSLVPYVALFERQYFLNEAFGRSRQLVNKQAVVFMITGFCALTVYIFGLYRLCVLLKSGLGVATNLLFMVGLLSGIVLANGGMVMLYRKRKLARH